MSLKHWYHMSITLERKLKEHLKAIMLIGERHAESWKSSRHVNITCGKVMRSLGTRAYSGGVKYKG